MKKIYLDHIAATPLLPAAREAMLPYLGATFGNPWSRHTEGDRPRKAIEEARSAVAELIGANPHEIIFTASGSEANNLAIKGALAASAKKGRHLITSVIEHFSVAHPLKRLQREGWEVTWLPTDSKGRIDPDSVAAAIRNDTVLVSIMHANNEIGTLQPIEAISAITKKAGLLLHTDAVATVGVVPLHLDRLGVEMAGFAAQSFYGPKGAGALYLRRGTRLFPEVEGGIQEKGRRAGTENVAAIVGMGVAAQEARRSLNAEGRRLALLRDRLINGLVKTVPLLHPTGDPKNRLPSIASVAVEYVDGEVLIRSLARRGILAASGSSCSTEALKISPVLRALGLPANVAQGGIIMSLGKETDDEAIEAVLSVFPQVVQDLRDLSPVYAGLSKEERG